MITSLVYIRIKQLYRFLAGIGLLRWCLVMLLLALLLFVLYQQLENRMNAHYTIAVVSLVLLTVQLKRLDKHFLKVHIAHYKWLMRLEYLALTAPVLLILQLQSHWLHIIAACAAVYIIPHLTFEPKQIKLNNAILQWIPDDNYEWKCEIRNLFFLLAPLYIIAVCTAFFIGSVPITIVIIGMIPLSFIDKNEPLQMLIAPELNTQQFLLTKIVRNVLFFSSVIAPLIFAFLIFHPEKWYIPIAAYFALISLHIFLIVMKYAFYEPNVKSPASQIFGTIGAMGAIIPIFLPVIWLLSIWFYYRSRANLQTYLHDYH